MAGSVTRRTLSLGMVPDEEDGCGAKARMEERLCSRAPRGAARRWAVTFVVLLVGFLLGGARPALAGEECKPAAPLPQSKCNKDAQCCAGLVCGPAGSSHNNAETQCQPGCRIGGVFYASGAVN